MHYFGTTHFLKFNVCGIQKERITARPSIEQELGLAFSREWIPANGKRACILDWGTTCWGSNHPKVKLETESVSEKLTKKKKKILFKNVYATEICG